MSEENTTPQAAVPLSNVDLARSTRAYRNNLRARVAEQRPQLEQKRKDAIAFAKADAAQRITKIREQIEDERMAHRLAVQLHKDLLEDLRGQIEEVKALVSTRLDEIQKEYDTEVEALNEMQALADGAQK